MLFRQHENLNASIFQIQIPERCFYCVCVWGGGVKLKLSGNFDTFRSGIFNSINCLTKIFFRLNFCSKGNKKQLSQKTKQKKLQVIGIASLVTSILSKAEFSIPWNVWPKMFLSRHVRSRKNKNIEKEKEKFHVIGLAFRETTGWKLTAEHNTSLPLNFHRPFNTM